MVGAGLLIILNFLCFGALFILFYRMREISRSQNILADRINVIEEMMLEMTADTVDEHENFDATLEEQVITETAPEEPLVFHGEEERTRRILELSGRGLSEERVAKESGYSIGEVRLIRNLHRRH